MKSVLASIIFSLLLQLSAASFIGIQSPNFISTKRTSSLNAEEAIAKSVTGGELEVMLQDWDMPLVLDAYATWCGPCLLMAPEFEAAAKELEGKVRFVKMDTDKEPEMAGRLNINGLPTLLFLSGKEGDDSVGVLRDRIEGALRKDSIVSICDYYFFDGPMPTDIQ